MSKPTALELMLLTLHTNGLLPVFPLFFSPFAAKFLEFIQNTSTIRVKLFLATNPESQSSSIPISVKNQTPHQKPPSDLISFSTCKSKHETSRTSHSHLISTTTPNSVKRKPKSPPKRTKRSLTPPSTVENTEKRSGVRGRKRDF